MKIEIEPRITPQYVTISEMKPGQIGISDGGRVYLKTNLGYASLSSPGAMASSAEHTIQVKLLDPGVKVILTVEESDR